MSAKFIVLDRQMGKTNTVIDWMRAAPRGVGRIMVCTDTQVVAHMRRQLHPEFKTWQFVAISSLQRQGDVFKHEGRAAGCQEFQLGIDNLDMMLRYLVHTDCDIEIVTATPPTLCEMCDEPLSGVVIQGHHERCWPTGHEFMQRDQ